MISNSKMLRVCDVSEKFLLLCIGASLYGPNVFVILAVCFLAMYFVTSFVIIRRVFEDK